DAQFALTDDLRRKGYVAKPIVGRCGANISIVGHGDEVLDETGGRFDKRETMYQEFFGLPQLEGRHMQISTFMVEGRYAGACVRADASPIIVGSSDIVPLRIVPDDELK
ncbi:MAG: bifunctional glutathionylspermidine amidase/glutathionylspermidine synthase, partial [Zetaproteobacteria bacterium CG_4_8_14_3_um_filter_59_5]